MKETGALEWIFCQNVVVMTELGKDKSVSVE